MVASCHPQAPIRPPLPRPTETTEPGGPTWESITRPGEIAISQAGRAVTFFWKGMQRH